MAHCYFSAFSQSDSYSLWSFGGNILHFRCVSVYFLYLWILVMLWGELGAFSRLENLYRVPDIPKMFLETGIDSHTEINITMGALESAFVPPPTI